MPRPTKVSDEVFIETWNRLQNASQVAKELDCDLRSLHRRRKGLEEKYGITLTSTHRNAPTFVVREHSPRVDCQLNDGVIMVASDAHYWPGVISTAHKAFVSLIRELKPSLIVMNGDLFDGATVSRFPKSDWSKPPSVKEEIEAVSDRLFEIKQAAANAKTWWCLGNHDMRFDTKLANMVPEFAGVQGFTLADHFPGWNMSISLFINNSLMIKHRFRNGTHATWNNTLYSGVNICTGHLHRLQATLLNDYAGVRWGIDCGTLAEIDGDHMHYGEDMPMNHCSGFAVLTIADGMLLHPEFCFVANEKAYFRGKQVKIGDWNV